MVWEAQYGDFINGAQAAVSMSFLRPVAQSGASRHRSYCFRLMATRARAQTIRAHDSSVFCRRLDTNMRVANCTSAAQYFHVLRTQALCSGPIRRRSSAAKWPASTFADRLDPRASLPRAGSGLSSTMTKREAKRKDSATCAVQR